MVRETRVRVARVYEDIDPDDGQRVLVDRIWPHGIRKDDQRVGIWCKDVAPSKELREWYHHQPERFDEFASRYQEELHDSGTSRAAQADRAQRCDPGDRDAPRGTQPCGRLGAVAQRPLMPIGLCETLVRCDWDCTRWNRCRRRPGGRRCRRGCGGRLWLRHLVGRRTCRDGGPARVALSLLPRRRHRGSGTGGLA